MALHCRHAECVRTLIQVNSTGQAGRNGVSVLHRLEGGGYASLTRPRGAGYNGMGYAPWPVFIVSPPSSVKVWPVA